MAEDASLLLCKLTTWTTAHELRTLWAFHEIVTSADTSEALSAAAVASRLVSAAGVCYDGLAVMALGVKGLGVVATRPFGRGERLLAELPLARLVADEWSSQSIFADGIAAVDVPLQEAFFALMQAAKYGPRKTARGIWLSNAYPIGSVGRKGDVGRKVRTLELNNFPRPLCSS